MFRLHWPVGISIWPGRVVLELFCGAALVAASAVAAGVSTAFQIHQSSLIVRLLCAGISCTSESPS